MSSLKNTEKRYLEKILDMAGGYVLDYNDATYGAFFHRHNVDIHGGKYETYGRSKAKKMRDFWDQEPDALVGKVLSEMLDVYETDCELGDREINAPVLKKARAIIERLTGKPEAKPKETEAGFLDRELAVPDIGKLPVKKAIVPIIESRLEEVRKVLQAGAYLSVVILCGSILEAVLLGSAQQNTASFNASGKSPKATKDRKVKPFQEWTLAQLIDVASDVGVLKPDIRKFSHGLRDFRNYIHPSQQIASRFAPDEHTAKVCLQVLKAALASVAGERE